MKFILLTTGTPTHTETSTGLQFNIAEVSDNSEISGPAEVRTSLTGLVDLRTPITTPPREISKLTIRRRLRELGKETAFNAFLSNVPMALADWNDSTVLLTTDPLFTEYAPMVKISLGLNDNQFADLIS